MMKTLKYSVLRYIPSKLSGEAINLGILFSEESTGFRCFRHTKNYGRITSFDEELNKNNIMLLLKGIKQEVLKEEYDGNFAIENFIKYYINNFKFEKPLTIEYEDLDSIQEELFGAYFRCDMEKSKRPNKDTDQKILSK